MQRIARLALSLVVGLGCGVLAVQVVAAQEYMIGRGDILAITVWGHADLSGDYAVNTDGVVAYPLLGPVRAEGSTAKQLTARLHELLAKDYLVNPHVIVSVKEYLSKKVSVLGEASNPGIHYLTERRTLLEILSKAGGFAKTAGKQLVLVRNHRPASAQDAPSNPILRLNIEKIEAGDATENIALEDGDMIFIPRAQAYFVLGEVQKPGTFALDKDTTVLEAVTLAGWFTDKAAPSGVKLLRHGPDGKQDALALDLSGTLPKDRTFKMRDGDTLFVPKGNTYFVFGEVRSPGAYQLVRATDILEAITMAGGFTDKASPSRTRIIRGTPQGQQVLRVNVNDLLKGGEREKMTMLQENDVIVIPESLF